MLNKFEFKNFSDNIDSHLLTWPRLFSVCGKGAFHYWAATCEIPCELDVKGKTCEIYHVKLMM